MSDWFADWRPKKLVGVPKQEPPRGKTQFWAPEKPWVSANTPESQLRLPSSKDNVRQHNEKMQRVAAQVVMHQFARSEVRALDKGEDFLRALVHEKLRAMPDFKRFSDAGIDKAISTLTRYLQDRDLTINFDARKWFSTPNEFTSYLQMYAKDAKVEPGKDGNPELRLPKEKDGAKNKTDLRVEADERVTFGANMNTPEGLRQREGIARLMRTGEVTRVKAPTNILSPTGKPITENRTTHFRIQNWQFNPKAKQVFAALNYGRRSLGSSIEYGNSVLILDEGLKRNAIYYMGDTLDDIDSTDRLTYGTLAGAFLTRHDEVVKDLLLSCLYLHRLPNTADGTKLLEAHIFGPVTFAHDVTRIRIAESEVTQEVLDNARAFKEKWNIRIWVVQENYPWGEEGNEVV